MPTTQLTVKDTAKDGTLTLQQITVKDKGQDSPLPTTQLTVKDSAEQITVKEEGQDCPPPRTQLVGPVESCGVPWAPLLCGWLQGGPRCA